MTHLFLEQFTWPNCDRGDDFSVDVFATVYLDAEDPTLAAEHFPDDDVTCVCLNCDNEGRVFDFRKTAEVQA